MSTVTYTQLMLRTAARYRDSEAAMPANGARRASSGSVNNVSALGGARPGQQPTSRVRPEDGVNGPGAAEPAH